MCRGGTTLGGHIRKLSQDPSNLVVIDPPLRVSPLVRRSRRTSLGVIELVQPPNQLLIRPDREDEIDTVWRIEIARLESERSSGKASGHTTWATRMEYGADGGWPRDVVRNDKEAVGSGDNPQSISLAEAKSQISSVQPVARRIGGLPIKDVILGLSSLAQGPLTIGSLIRTPGPEAPNDSGIPLFNVRSWGTFSELRTFG